MGFRSVFRNEFSIESMRVRSRRKKALHEASYYLDLWADYGYAGHLKEAIAILEAPIDET